jgi:hypothetical protein
MPTYRYHEARHDSQYDRQQIGNKDCGTGQCCRLPGGMGGAPIAWRRKRAAVDGPINGNSGCLANQACAANQIASQTSMIAVNRRSNHVISCSWMVNGRATMMISRTVVPPKW